MPGGFDSPQEENPEMSLRMKSPRDVAAHQMNILTNKTVITRPMNNSAI